MRVAKSSAKASARTSTNKRISGSKSRAKLIGLARSRVMMARTTRVGMNLKKEMTVAESGRIKRGKAEFRINFPPLVIDFAPIVNAFVTR